MEAQQLRPPQEGTSVKTQEWPAVPTTPLPSNIDPNLSIAMEVDNTPNAEDRTRRATSVLSMDDIEAAQALEGLRAGEFRGRYIQGGVADYTKTSVNLHLGNNLRCPSSAIQRCRNSNRSHCFLFLLRPIPCSRLRSMVPCPPTRRRSLIRRASNMVLSSLNDISGHQLRAP